MAEGYHAHRHMRHGSAKGSHETDGGEGMDAKSGKAGRIRVIFDTSTLS